MLALIIPVAIGIGIGTLGLGIYAALTCLLIELLDRIER